MSKIQLPFIKQDVGLGDLVQQFVDPSHRYIGCARCRARQQLLNSLLSFSGPAQQPVQQPRPLPSDWSQSYQGQQPEQEED